VARQAGDGSRRRARSCSFRRPRRSSAVFTSTITTSAPIGVPIRATANASTGVSLNSNDGRSAGSSSPAVRRIFATDATQTAALSSQQPTRIEWSPHPRATTPTSGTAFAATSPTAAARGPVHDGRTPPSCRAAVVRRQNA